MSREQYRKEVNELVAQIGSEKERLWRQLKREEYEDAAKLRDQIKMSQEQLKSFLQIPVLSA